MIIDGHAYCFPPLGEASGFPSARAHLRYLQREMAEHHQPAWRLRDGAPGDNATLADPADRTLNGVREVSFRPGGYDITLPHRYSCRMARPRAPASQSSSPIPKAAV